MTSSLRTALRVQQRRLDRVRFAIAEATQCALALQKSWADLNEAAEAERKFAIRQPISFDAYFRGLKSEQAALAGDLDLANRNVEELRKQAQNELGALQALERAIEGYRREEQRVADRAEQAAADDRHSAEIARRARRQRHGRVQ